MYKSYYMKENLYLMEIHSFDLCQDEDRRLFVQGTSAASLFVATRRHNHLQRRVAVVSPFMGQSLGANLTDLNQCQMWSITSGSQAKYTWVRGDAHIFELGGSRVMFAMIV
jgi:hypothetical protein